MQGLVGKFLGPPPGQWSCWTCPKSMDLSYPATIAPLQHFHHTHEDRACELGLCLKACHWTRHVPFGLALENG